MLALQSAWSGRPTQWAAAGPSKALPRHGGRAPRRVAPPAQLPRPVANLERRHARSTKCKAEANRACQAGFRFQHAPAGVGRPIHQDRAHDAAQPPHGLRACARGRGCAVGGGARRYIGGLPEDALHLEGEGHVCGRKILGALPAAVLAGCGLQLPAHGAALARMAPAGTSSISLPSGAGLGVDRALGGARRAPRGSSDVVFNCFHGYTCAPRSPSSCRLAPSACRRARVGSSATP